MLSVRKKLAVTKSLTVIEFYGITRTATLFMEPIHIQFVDVKGIKMFVCLRIVDV